MKPFRWTIQKKFLFLLLFAGLIPAVVAVGLITVGGGRVFSWAMGGPVETRALELATKLDGLIESRRLTLAETIAQVEPSHTALARAGASAGADVVVMRMADGTFVARAARLSDPALIAAAQRSAPYFENLHKSERVTSTGYLGDIMLPVENSLGGTVGMIVFAYPMADGSLVAFFVRADGFVAEARTALSGTDDQILLYSRKGVFLNSSLPPTGLGDFARRELVIRSQSVSGRIDFHHSESGSESWYLVGYSACRSQNRLSGIRSADAPWTLMLPYDMESFLGPQSRLVWSSVVAGIVWAMLLVLLSIQATLRIIGPVKRLRKQAEAMAQGDLSARAEVQTRDEIHDLGEAFNKMADKLEKSHERITALAQDLEEKVRQRTSDLERANQKLMQTEKYAATGRLAAQFAHEINNPLGIIKNYLKIVAKGLERSGGGRRATDPNLDHVGIINEELDRIARIVRQLLDLHRPAPATVMETDVNALLKSTTALLEQSLSKKNIRLVTEYDPDLPRPTVAPDQIRQVFINLLQNAEDAIEGESGEITVKSRRQRQWDGECFREALTVSISDTGPGISQENLTRIFDPFFTTKGDKGTGLGLSVSYGIVQMHNGSIEAFSEPGRGTTMVVTLPVANSPAVEPRGDDSEANFGQIVERKN